MHKEDISSVTPLYIEYWNSTGDSWIPELVYKRIWQVIGSPDSYAMIAQNENGIIGFVMGRFETFYDLTAYNLVDVIVALKYQNAGMGTNIMKELEHRVKNMGAAMIQLYSVNDEQHEHFYGKLGYKDASNLKMKSKFL